jgi:hypothetical protein
MINQVTHAIILTLKNKYTIKKLNAGVGETIFFNN